MSASGEEVGVTNDVGMRETNVVEWCAAISPFGRRKSPEKADDGVDEDDVVDEDGAAIDDDVVVGATPDVVVVAVDMLAAYH